MPAEPAKRVRRYDRGELAPAVRLSNGWLRVEGRSARVGILEYDNPDGTKRRELVLPEDLADADSLDSARMVPVVNTHPEVGLLDAATAKGHQVGSVGENLRIDGDYLIAPLMITDGEAVKVVEAGRSELSWGYDCEMDPPRSELVPKWGVHDGIQRHRKYNHLAVVDRARAGDFARIRLDGEGNAQLEFAPPAGGVLPIIATQQSPAAQNPEKKMPVTIRIDGHSYSAEDPALQQAIDRAFAQTKADGEKVVLSEKQRADALAEVVKHVKANALQRGAIVVSLLARRDAAKARMASCDECAGSQHGPGKVDDGEGKPVKCDYCDGKGTFRMHDAVKAMGSDEESEPEAEKDDDDDGAKMVDDDDIERESPAEEKIEKSANPEHRDAAKRRADEKKAAKKRRADSLERMIARAAKARAALIVEAGKHLGADVKLDAKGNAEIRRDVVAKLAPHVKLDGLGEREVALLYSTEVARVEKARADGTLNPSDQLRAMMLGSGGGGGGGQRQDKTLADKIAAAEQAKYHSHERPTK